MVENDCSQFYLIHALVAQFLLFRRSLERAGGQARAGRTALKGR